MMKKAIYFGLGAISLSREKAEKMIQEMVEKGEMSKDEAHKFVDDAIKRGEEEKNELRQIIREEIRELKEIFAGSQSEIDDIKSKLKDLESRLS
jgi:polyhydroxyalkanoate synthesis regulator phasin